VSEDAVEKHVNNLLRKLDVTGAPTDHRRVMAVLAFFGVDRRQIKLHDSVEHRPHQVPLRHPVTDRRRHQEHLLTVTTDKPRAHTREGSRCDRTAPPFPDSLREEEQSGRGTTVLSRTGRSPRRCEVGGLLASFCDTSLWLEGA
jgi:hypothetical protein